MVGWHTITDRGLHAAAPRHSECALHLFQRPVYDRKGIELTGQTPVRSGQHRPWCGPHDHDPQRTLCTSIPVPEAFDDMRPLRDPPISSSALTNP